MQAPKAVAVAMLSAASGGGRFGKVAAVTVRPVAEYPAVGWGTASVGPRGLAAPGP